MTTTSAGPHTVVVIGAAGRMGRFAVDLIAASSEFHVAATLDHDARTPTPERLATCQAELGLDFTVAGSGRDHGRAMIAAGIRPIIGTSGVSPEEVTELDQLARARGLGGIVVPNFSLGMVVLQRVACETARYFPACEIVELHHDRKVDAPSATAADTARRIAAARTDGRGPIPIHSVRLPGLYSHQEVLFGGPGEALRLRHDMLGPEAFGAGILCALRFAAGAVGVTVGLEAAL